MPQHTPQDSQSVDQLLLEVRSDKYGDTGNYNTETLKQAIEAYVTTQVKEALSEKFLELHGILYTKNPDPKWGENRRYGFKEGLDYANSVARKALTTTTNGKEE